MLRWRPSPESVERKAALAIVAAFAGVFAGCAAWTVQPPDLVTLGLAVPASGPDLVSGKAAENGARLAIEELNRELPLVGGRRVRFQLLVVDEGPSPTSAAGAARYLANSNVKGVLGHLKANTASVAADIYANVSMPFLAPVRVGPGFKPGSRTSFTVGPVEPPADAANLTTLAARAVGLRSVAIVSDQTLASSLLASAIVSDASASGIETQRIDSSSRSADFSDIFQRLKASRFDGVVFTGSPERTHSFVQQLVKSGIATKLISAGQPCPERGQPTPGTLEVVCASRPVVAGIEVAALSDFKSKYFQKFGTSDLPVATATYDSVKVLAQAMRRAGSVEPRDYLAKLNGAMFGGVGNPIVFGTDQDSRGDPIVVYASSRGKREPIATYRMAGSLKSVGLSFDDRDGFPWPPPSPSSMLVMARSLVLGTSRANQTLGQVDTRFGAALTQAGYVDKSYYEIPGGYAVVTRLERISDDGRPDATDRFPSSGAQSRGMSISQYFRALFSAPLGRYRVIVFVVTDKAFRPSASELTSIDAAQLLSKGFNRLPDGLASQAYGAERDCTAMVYEFETSVATPTGRRIGVNEAISAAVHLDRSRVLAALSGT